MKKKIVTAFLLGSLCLSLVGCGGKASTLPDNTTTLTGISENTQQEVDTAEDNSDDENVNDSIDSTLAFVDDLDNQIVISEAKKVAVMSGSFAQVWQLAGGDLYATTEDAWDDESLNLGDDVINLGSLKNPNVETIIDSDVDFVILSANIEGHVAIGDTLKNAGINTAYFDIETFDDYLDMLHICAEITGDAKAYKENGLEIKKQIEEQIERVDGTEKNVLLIRAYSSGAKARNSNNMTGKMLKDLGCTNIADSDKGLLEDLSMEAIIAQDPDYIFVTIMGDEDAALQTVEQLLTSNPAWNELSAVKNNRYYVLDKELFHNKPNNRWGESYKILADILYGEQ